MNRTTREPFTLQTAPRLNCGGLMNRRLTDPNSVRGPRKGRRTPCDHAELNAGIGMPRSAALFTLYYLLVHAQGGSPMSRNRFAILAAASLFALSVSLGSVFAAGEPDPPSSRNPNPPQKQAPVGQQKVEKKKKKD